MLDSKFKQDPDTSILKTSVFIFLYVIKGKTKDL